MYWLFYKESGLLHDTKGEGEFTEDDICPATGKPYGVTLHDYKEFETQELPPTAIKYLQKEYAADMAIALAGIKIKDLTNEELQSQFVEAFYFHPDNPLNIEEDCNSDNPIPWGQPWYWGTQLEKELRGSTIKEMAYNYFEEIEKDIHYAIEMSKEEE